MKKNNNSVNVTASYAASPTSLGIANSIGIPSIAQAKKMSKMEALATMMNNSGEYGYTLVDDGDGNLTAEVYKL